MMRAMDAMGGVQSELDGFGDVVEVQRSFYPESSINFNYCSD